MYRTGTLRPGIAAVAAVALAGLAGMSSPSPALAAPGASSSAPTAGSDPDAEPRTHPIQPVCALPSPGTAEAQCASVIRTDVQGPTGVLPAGQSPTGFGPADLQDAYNLPSTTAGTGAGETVAIVDAYDNPSAEDDLGLYRTQFGLPACTTANGCFRKVDQRGGTNYPVTDTGWGEEIALDVDMVSAACPQCDILLVEADDNSFASLFAAVAEAVALGAKFVSNSYHGPEFSDDPTTDEQTFNHPGVAITVAAGDNGYGPTYPAASRYVTAVGGTSLTKDSSTRGWSEKAWSGTGSGCSQFDSKPPFQHDTGCSMRTVADVSAVADPQTGVATYDTFGEPGWMVSGGTSVATPIIASTYALAGVPGSNDQPNSYPYDAPAGSLNDVTSGDNGACGSYLCTARTGYDGPTGLGTPNGLKAFEPNGSHGLISGTVTSGTDGHPLAGAHVTAGPASAITDAQGRYVMSLPSGSYAVTVTSVFGYADASATGVTVTDGGNTVQNFAMVAEPTVTVSGTVTDGSGHGWPLYAQVQAVGTPAPPAFTDPFTGVYHLTLPANASYTLRTTAQSSGYQLVNIPVSLGSGQATQNVAVPVDPGACVAPGYTYRYDGLANEPFNSSTGPPPGWTVTDATGNGGWVFNDPHSPPRTNLTGGGGNFAILDSDFLGQGNHEDTSLITPPIDLTGVSAPVVSFDTDLLTSVLTVADVDVSTDGGTTWTNVWHHTTDSVRNTPPQTVPIPTASGQSNVRVRFHYQDTWGFWWEVDNVYVGQRACAPIPGGLVAGQVTDANTNATVNDATVTSADVPAETTTSTATPDDENLADGFYSLFSSVTGQHSFTASKQHYQDRTAPVSVTADAVIRADLALPAGHVVVAPGQIRGTQTLGTTGSQPVTFSNDGTAPIRVTLAEGGGSAPLAPEGAPLQQIAGTFSPLFTGTDPGGTPAPAITAPHTAPWVALADFPTSVRDSAVAVADNGKVYSFGGRQENNSPAHSAVYDPTTQIWAPIPEMTTPRDAASVAYVGGRFYLIGGWDATTGALVASTEIFDPATNTWSTGAANPRPHAAAAVTVLHGRIYVVGGCNVSSASCGSLDVMVYNPATNTWAQAQRYPQATSWAGCGTINSLIYCAGGISGDTSTRSAFSYDPATNTWRQIPDLPIDLWGMATAAANGTLVMSGGITNGTTTVTNQGFAFDPRTEVWQNIPNAENAVYRAGAACGLVTIGGATDSALDAVDFSKELPGLNQCDGTPDVSWLSENNTGFTLQPGQNITVTATLDANGPTLNVPADYTAQMALETDSPYQVSPIGVTMTVTAPDSWAQTVGTVVGTDCSGKLVPVNGATVQVVLTNSTFTLRSDSEHTFNIWLAAPGGPLTLKETMPGWQPTTIQTTISPGDQLISILATSPNPVCP
ncbi:MAG TPA: carboxypeptidase regulatory-like domain-containing protein [Mycobacteriales bacterium]|nr:carboxypeptidase regulatory-like domain-containing protein [Mycobacteriales bacterium]